MSKSRSVRSGFVKSASRYVLAMAALTLAASADWPVSGGVVTPALAQRVAISAEFRTALQPYGSWGHHSRWGDVWVPAGRARDWRPYTDGHWAYTDDWGWYWISDDEEASWGWIVYHYGHWVLDPDLGWIWVPGDEWGPGWVQWRRGGEYIGWAPLPPDDQVVVEYRDEPNVWIFVRDRDFIAPRIESVILPERRYSTFIRDTVVENRAVEFRDQHFAVNPGIAPGVIAAAVGHPIRSFDVRPHVLAGTGRIKGAVEVRADELGRLRENREAFRDTARESQHEFRPMQQVPRPQALGANERGRLGDNPPRAVPRGAVANAPPVPGTQPGMQGRAQQPTQQERAQQERSQQERARQERTLQQPSATQGLGAPNRRELQPQEGRAGANQPNTVEPQRDERQGRETLRGGPSGDRTQGLAPEERRMPQQSSPAQGTQRGIGRDNQRELSTRDLGTRDLGTRDLGTRDLGTRDLGTRDNRQLEGRQPQVMRPSQSTQGPARGEERQLGRQPEMTPPSTQGMAPREERQPGPQPGRQPPRPNVGGTEGFAGGGQRSMPPSQPQQMRAPQPQVQQGAGGGPGDDRRGRQPGG
jgi:hypothetical protein